VAVVLGNQQYNTQSWLYSQKWKNLSPDGDPFVLKVFGPVPWAGKTSEMLRDGNPNPRYELDLVLRLIEPEEKWSNMALIGEEIVGF